MKSKSVGFMIMGMMVTAAVTGSLIDFAMTPSHSDEGASADLASVSSTRPLELGDIQSSKNKTEKETAVILNDPAINQAWGIKKTNAQQAWELSQGSRDIIVAVIDTGIDDSHEDLAQNLWTNPGETGLDAKGKNKATNGVDDDKNGFTDDVHGWDFVSNKNDLVDNHGHGTHIAGIIGAVGGNNKGIIGIAPKVSLMVLKYYDPKVPNTNNLQNTINALKYAIQMNAHIINYSGGGTSFSKEEHEQIKIANDKGILVVAAAGNEKSNSDVFKYYPADYDLDNIISVTAIDPTTKILSSSNWGKHTVDIAAPGQNIMSTLPGNTYGYMTGTSQATAFVTGAAALIMAHKESYNASDVKKYVLATGDSEQSLAEKTGTSRKLNLFKSLAVLDQGVGASGVVARNTSSMKNEFTADPNDRVLDNNAQVALFSKSLLKSITVEQQKN